jgi:hypothetical protein
LENIKLGAGFPSLLFIATGPPLQPVFDPSFKILVAVAFATEVKLEKEIKFKVKKAIKYKAILDLTTVEFMEVPLS